MWLKIAVAFLVPVLCAAGVVGLLKATHHYKIPPLALPSVTDSPVANSHVSPVAVPVGTCLGVIPGHFTGIAVQGNPSATLATYGKTFPAAKLRIMEFYNAFKRKFPLGEASQAVEDGLTPLIQLNAFGVNVQQIADGKWDGHLRHYAEAVKAFACRIILSFGHEMNGWWYPWGHRPAPKSSTSPSAFKAAWKHIYKIFAKVGASNVIWSWDPSHQYNQRGVGKIATPASEWYPGNAYVNWVGLDGYLGYDPNGNPQNFKAIFGFQLQNIRSVAKGKPIYLAETGVTRGPHLANQVAELFAGVAAYHLMGLVWFDAKSQKHDYRLGIYPAVDAAYRQALAGFVKRFGTG